MNPLKHLPLSVLGLLLLGLGCSNMAEDCHRTLDCPAGGAPPAGTGGTSTIATTAVGGAYP